MSRILHDTARAAAHPGLATVLVTVLMTVLLTLPVLPAWPVTHPSVPCSTLTVTIATRAEIPAGTSVRALQDGRNYPPQCR